MNAADSSADVSTDISVLREAGTPTSQVDLDIFAAGLPADTSETFSITIGTQTQTVSDTTDYSGEIEVSPDVVNVPTSVTTGSYTISPANITKSFVIAPAPAGSLTGYGDCSSNALPGKFSLIHVTLHMSNLIPNDQFYLFLDGDGDGSHGGVELTSSSSGTIDTSTSVPAPGWGHSTGDVVTWYLVNDDDGSFGDQELSNYFTLPAPPTACLPVSHVGVERPRDSGQNSFFFATGSVPGGGIVQSTSFGNLGDTPLFGDWSGTDNGTVGVWRPSESAFYLDWASPSAPNPFSIGIHFGDSTDLPLMGKFGTNPAADTIGVFRPSTGTFYLASSNTDGGGTIQTVHFASPGDIPIAGDWNGDGTTTVGIFRPSTGTFYLAGANVTGGGAVTVLHFASPGDEPVVGDWNGDGKTDLGVFRPSNATFYLAGSTQVGGAPVTAFNFGNPTDKPFVTAP